MSSGSVLQVLGDERDGEALRDAVALGAGWAAEPAAAAADDG